MTFLDFSPDYPTTITPLPIDEAALRRFEAEFAPLVAARNSIYGAIPGAESWPAFVPSREKVLEYYLTIQALEPTRRTVYLDVASCLSLFPNYLAESLGCQVARQDLLYQPGEAGVRFPKALHAGGTVRHFRFRAFRRDLTFTVAVGPDTSRYDFMEMPVIGCDACELPLPDSSLDAMALHCSFEHFEGDSDTRFVREAMRVLRPGGGLLIIPFYCGEQGVEVFKPDFAPGCQFHRYYDPGTFRERVLDKLGTPVALEVRLYPNVRQVDSSFYCDYSILLRKSRRKT